MLLYLLQRKIQKAGLGDVPLFGIAELYEASWDPIARCWSVQESKAATDTTLESEKSMDVKIRELRDIGIGEKEETMGVTLFCDVCIKSRAATCVLVNDVQCEACQILGLPCTESSPEVREKYIRHLLPPPTGVAQLVDLGPASMGESYSN